MEATLKQPQMAEPLNSVQLMLLNTFNKVNDEKEMEDISRLLCRYYAEKLDEEIDKLYEDGTLSDEILDEWSNEHLRTPYSLARNEQPND